MEIVFRMYKLAMISDIDQYYLKEISKIGLLKKLV